MVQIAASDGQWWSPKVTTAEMGQMKLLTVQDVADSMKVSEKTVRRLIKRGDLAAYKVGDRGQLRINVRDLEGYLETQRVSINVPDELTEFEK